VQRVAFPSDMFHIPLRENVLTSVLPSETRGRCVVLLLRLSIWKEEFWMAPRAHRGGSQVQEPDNYWMYYHKECDQNPWDAVGLSIKRIRVNSVAPGRIQTSRGDQLLKATARAQGMSSDVILG
jgi:hypothetical protein